MILIVRFEPSEVARQNEAAQGNMRHEDVVPINRKRTGPQGQLLPPPFPVKWDQTDGVGDVMTKYIVVDGVDSLQKFGQDAWSVFSRSSLNIPSRLTSQGIESCVS